MRYPAILCLLILALGCMKTAHAENGGVGFVKKANGEVYLLRGDAEQKVEPGQQIFTADTVITGRASDVAIIFQDGTRMTLGAQSELEVQLYKFAPHQQEYDFSLYLKKGSMIYSSGKLGKLAPEKVNLRTPRATVGIRGTRFLLSVN